jgi:hypothetical protein
LADSELFPYGPVHRRGCERLAGTWDIKSRVFFETQEPKWRSPMKKFVLAAAAAGTLLAGGVGVANAQWSLSNGFRGEGGAWPTYRYYPADARGEAGSSCRFVTVREHRGGEVVVRRVQRC